MATNYEPKMGPFTRVVLIALLSAAALGIGVTLLFDQDLRFGDAPTIGGLAAFAVLAALIFVAATWQSLPHRVKRLGKYSLFNPLTRRRRARLLREPFSQDWLSYLRSNVAVYNILSPDEQKKLQDILRVLIAEKQWEGCRGVEITDEIKVTVAAQAAVLLLNLDHDYFQAVSSILVYPTGFMVPHEDMGADGVLQNVPVLGQAWYRGPVMLAWDRVLAEGRMLHPRESLVYHEFAHQLDFMGDVGEPAADRSRDGFMSAYRRVMREEYKSLVRASEEGTATLLDHYGATDHREFFAVATSCFFTQPRAMLEQHPRLYDVLRQYYGQDPAAREPQAFVSAQ